MLIFEGEAVTWYFIHVNGRVVVNPMPSSCVISVTNGTLFEGTRAECEAEYERLGLTPLEDEL